MKYQYLGERYQDDNGTDVFDVKVGNAILKGLKATKQDESKCRNCKFWRKCNEEEVFRKYDCKMNLKKLKRAYKMLTTIIVGIWAFFVFSQFKFNFFYQMALIVLSLVGFNIVCTFGEWCAPKIYNWFFCLKLKKLLKIRKKEKAVEEAKAKAEEEAKIRDVPGYQGVKNARTIVQKLSEISKQCDYGSNTFNINCCVESCEIIMKMLEKDYSDYYRVSDVFELYLPRVCTAIEMYKKTIDANGVTEEVENLFAQFIQDASTYLNKKKNEAIYYNNVAEINLSSSTDILEESLQEETKE